ncbi:MAG: FHA domain-containing protein [Thermoleophilia bacterium]|nr:FHA domain-containing protein [Thermoleophilia bacterium]
MRLTIRSGARTGELVEITGERFVVGREADCDLALAEEKVSRHHAALERLPDGSYQLRDLGSTNGTFVNGRRISEPVKLQGGEEIRFGDTATRVEAERPGAAPTAVAAQAPATVRPPVVPPPPRPVAGLFAGRGKWIAAAAVAAGIAGLGTALGLILTGGGDTRTLLASAPEAVTVFVTAPAETEPPPAETGEVPPAETGEVPPAETAEVPPVETEQPPPAETGSEGVEPSDAELDLLSRIPVNLQPCWRPSEEVNQSDRGAVAAVGCDTGETGFAIYYQFDGSESLDAWYRSWIVTFGADFDTGLCDQDESAEGAVLAGEEERGRVVCGSMNEATRGIAWTDSALVIGAVAFEEGSDVATRTKLYETWQTLGPVD